MLIIEEQIENLNRKIEIIKQNETARTRKCNILNKNLLEILIAEQRWQKSQLTGRYTKYQSIRYSFLNQSLIGLY